MFIVIVGLLFLAGLANAVWQKIELRRGVSDDYGIAREEKDIGLLLSGRQPAYPVYNYGWTWVETLDYYDNGLPLYDASGGKLPSAYYLIVPAELFQVYIPSAEFQQKSSLLYAGQNLQLYRVGE